MRRSFRILIGLVAVLAPAGAQDTGPRSNRVLHDLALTQKRAADDLAEKLEDIRALAADARRWRRWPASSRSARTPPRR